MQLELSKQGGEEKVGNKIRHSSYDDDKKSQTIN